MMAGGSAANSTSSKEDSGTIFKISTPWQYSIHQTKQTAYANMIKHDQTWSCQAAWVSFWWFFESGNLQYIMRREVHAQPATQVCDDHADSGWDDVDFRKSI